MKCNVQMTNFSYDLYMLFIKRTGDYFVTWDTTKISQAMTVTSPMPR